MIWFLIKSHQLHFKPIGRLAIITFMLFLVFLFTSLRFCVNFYMQSFAKLANSYAIWPLHILLLTIFSCGQSISHSKILSFSKSKSKKKKRRTHNHSISGYKTTRNVIKGKLIIKFKTFFKLSISEQSSLCLTHIRKQLFQLGSFMSVFIYY